MRKIVQKQIMDMIPAIWDGVQYIQTAEPNRAVQVLDDCLLAMETLQESLRSGLSQQRFLYYRQYYAQVVLAMKQLNDKGSIENQIPEIYNGLDKMLTDITNEAEVKVEILFLPYKASMWDSLESIWLAAKDDSKCDSYVMPIPYCDRNPDGSPAAWHCEADLFPDYVPVIDFNQYDITKRKPDVVYIHNPYDEYNRVTSVDPKYYSSELKKHTDMLVYVPYFVVGDFLGEHFCQTAGVVNADKVIAESEEIKKQYELYYPSGNPPENKFLALGSPKFDKVLNSSRTDFVLPKKWQDLMQGKKVILYNTSLAAMLENPNESNKKLRYVLSVFKNRKDVILWWRPHPLVKATMQSMHPEIFREYENIEKEYKSMSWGIYDDSADLHRAISWSDAYYGDRSSVVSLYQSTKKPVMIQKSRERGYALCFSCIEINQDKDIAWCISYNLNGIIQFNLKNNSIEFLGNDLDEKLGSGVQYRALNKIDGKLIIFPYFGKCILEYDLVEKKFQKKKILNELLLQKNEIGINVSVSYKEYIYAFSNQGEIIRYSVKNSLCKYYKNPLKSIKRKRAFLGCSYVLQKEKVLLPILGTNLVLEFNMKLERTIIHTVGSENNQYSGITFDGEYYWLLQEPFGTVVKWNYSSQKVTEYNSDFITANKGQKLFFIDIAFDGENVILFPGIASVMIKIDAKTGKLFYINLNKNDTELYYEFAVNTPDGKVVTLNRANNELQWLYKGNIEKRCSVVLTDVLTKKITATKFKERSEKKNDAIIEDSWDGINYFLQWTARGISKSLDGNPNEVSDSGKKIYHIINSIV